MTKNNDIEEISLKDLTKTVAKSGNYKKVAKAHGADKLKKDLAMLRKGLVKESPEDKEPASPDEKSMAMRQAKFIQYVGEEIMEHLEQDNDFPEWMQNKLSALHQKAKDMHATMAGEYEDDDEEEMEEAWKQDSGWKKPAVHKDKYGNVIKTKNVAKSLAKSAAKQSAVTKEEVEQIDEISRVDYKKHGGTFADLRKQAQAKVDKEINSKNKSTKKEEVELDEDVRKMSHSRLKFHMNNKHIPHGSYSFDQMKAERDRRLKTGQGDAYKKAKMSMSEEVELDEAKSYGPGHIGAIQRMLDKERENKKKKSNEAMTASQHRQAMIDKIKKSGAVKSGSMAKEEYVNEKLSVGDGMSAWIDDFKKSDAPQFKGKDEKERRDMAIAAYLSAKRGDKK
jgi:hypothetical protein